MCEEHVGFFHEGNGANDDIGQQPQALSAVDLSVTRHVNARLFEAYKFRYCLEPMKEYLSAYYSNSRGITTILDLSDCKVPDGLARKKKSLKLGKTISLIKIPIEQASVAVVTCVGSGSFGHAILAKVGNHGKVNFPTENLAQWGEWKVFKVDRDKNSVMWEAFIQATVTTHELL